MGLACLPAGKTVGILQPGYLPWLGFFEQLSQSDIFVIYDDVQFEKGSWRNRNRIKTPSGPLWLSVPVKQKGVSFSLIKDVKINALANWQRKHVRSIFQNYSKAPYYDWMADDLFTIIDRPWRFLIDLDLELIKMLADKLGIITPMRLSSDLNIRGAGMHRLIDIIKKLDGNRFYEGSSGRNYIDERVMQQQDIQVIYQDFAHPTYPQLNGEFISHLSIIDLLFNAGPDSYDILTSTSGQEEK
jgi:hypothetical protein